jgi:hypothetical protein
MTALAADKIRITRGLPTHEERTAIATGATLYVGSLANIVTTTGRARSAAAAASRRFAGLVVRLEGASGVGTGVGNTSGTEYAVIQAGHEALVNIITARRTNTSLRLSMFIADDDSVSGTAVGTAAVRVPAGELTAFEASNKSTGWLALGRAAVAGNIAI